MILSIITVNKNNSKGLVKTLDSVICQKNIDFEHIIIDGASTDESIATIKSYYQSVSNCRWKSEPDSGVYQAMNKGIRMSKGDYLLFLNSGDFLINEKVLENVFLTIPSADILCGRCNISKDGRIVHTTNPPDFITFGFLFNTGLAHQSTFIRKELFNQIGLYREDFIYNADIDFWYKSIIVANSKTQKLEFIISDYNLDGISSKENKSDSYKKEMNIILSQFNFNRFVPDYDACNKEKESNEVLAWFKTKKILFKLLTFIYWLATIFVYLIKNKKLER